MGKETSEADDPSEYKDESIAIREEDMLSYEEKMKFISPIAKPMAPKKLAKKIYKLIKKASKEKRCLLSGIKVLQKELRKGTTGIVIFAGDVLPIDIMSHLPVVCEDKDIPYCYTPSRRDLGLAMGVKRTALVVLVPPRPDYQELYDEVQEAIKVLPPPP